MLHYYSVCVCKKVYIYEWRVEVHFRCTSVYVAAPTSFSANKLKFVSRHDDIHDMTNLDVMITVLSETCGKPFDELKASFPKKAITSKMLEELTDEKANKMLAELRKEKTGIAAWAIDHLKRT